MSWTRIDDQFSDHPKLVSAGPIAMALQVAAFNYCSRFLTDGAIPGAFAEQKAKQTLEQVLKHLLSDRLITDQLILGGIDDKVKPESLIQVMLDHGLWEKTQTGYMVHDFLEYNPSKAQVLEERQKRAEAGRKGGLSHKSKSSSTCLASASGLLHTLPKQNGSTARPLPDPVNKEKSSPPVGGPTSGAASKKSKLASDKADDGKPNSEFRRITDYFNAVYERKFGEPYEFKREKDGKAASELLRRLGFEKLRHYIDLYFETEDDWITKQGREWSKLNANINLLKQINSRNGPVAGIGNKPAKTSQPTSNEEFENYEREHGNKWPD